jgi:N-methylhydantoinase B
MPATTAHHVDVGGQLPGFKAFNSTEIFQEGLRIAPLKLVERRKPVEALWSLIKTNVRLPAQLFGDLRLRFAFCEILIASSFGWSTTAGSRPVIASCTGNYRLH